MATGYRPIVKPPAMLARSAERIRRYWFRRLKRISPLDTMFRWAEADHYARVGRSALECIASCMSAVEQSEPSSILDFGCGYGRVLRVLREEFPNAEIAACDVDHDAVRFCTRRFGATGVYSSTDPREVRFDGKFNLIWAGSVFTHIDLAAWQGMLPALAGALNTDGLLIFTTEGPSVVPLLRCGEIHLGPLEPEAGRLAAQGFIESGFGYGNYRPLERHDFPSGRYGITVVDPDRVRSLANAAGLRVAHYIPAGWDNHQDVFACRLASRLSN